MKFTEAYSAVNFKVDTVRQEVLIAFLDHIGFEAYEQEEHALIAYILGDDLTDSVVTKISLEFKDWYDSFEVKKLPQKNWNESWEASFQPIVVNTFCAVRASFHDPVVSVQYELIIDPKMAFGTGHHATTWMMMDHMSELEFKDQTVLDFGAGTGILAILAAKMRAKHIDAVEIDAVAVENCKNNAVLNNQPHIQSIEGGIDQVPQIKYDLILANINRMVILASLNQLINMLKVDGKIVFSGILAEDEHKVLDKISATDLVLTKKVQKGDWISLRLSR